MPAVVGVNAGGFKTTDDLRENSGIQIPTPAAEGQLVQIADRHAVRDIEVACTIPRREVAPVWRGARIRFQFFRRIVQTTRVGIGGAKVQAVSELPCERRFQAVVLSYSDGIGVLDVPKIGERYAG